MYFTENDKFAYLEWYEEYLRENLQKLPNTIASYSLVMKDYFDYFLINKVNKENYDEFFSIERMSLIERRANYVRASISNFLEFLYENGFIKNEEKRLRYKENITSSFSQLKDEQVGHKKQRKRDYITPNEIRNIFEGDVIYKDINEEMIAPIICCFSFFYMFKQRDVLKLTLNDVDLEQKKIRNVRVEDNPNLVEWLEINETTFKFLERYIYKYRDSFKTEKEELILLKGDPIQNNDINNIMRCYERKKNSDLFKGAINQENLLKTKMLYTLISTEGKGITDILIEQNMDEYLKQALVDFAEKKRVEYSELNVNKTYHYNDILPQKAID